jgi:hypothetical protein
MKRLHCVILVFFLVATARVASRSQSIVQIIPLPNTTFWNQAWGLAADSTRLYISSGTSTTSAYNYGYIYATDFNGVPVDSLNSNSGASQGLAYDGTHFYYVRRYTAACAIYKLTRQGALVDSLRWPSNRYLGGACWDGTHLWVSDYTSTSIANPTYLYKINWATKSVVDSIQTIGLQPQGIAWDGQYLYYAMDLNGSEPNQNLIYVVNPVTRDTVRTIPMPEPPNVDSNPRGLAWDGRYLWLIAEPVGASSGRSLYKYDLGGSGTPDIHLVPSSLHFGNRRINTTYVDSLQIQNVGTAPLRIDSMTAWPASVWWTDLQLPVTIPAGSFHRMRVWFQPAFYGSFAFSTTLYTNDPDEFAVTLALNGFGIYGSPTMVVPPSHDFASRRVGGSSSWFLTVQNQGAERLSLSSISTTTSAFSVDSVVLPLHIDSLGSATLRVWFRPTAATPYRDTVKIISNASNMPLARIVVSGNGDATPIPLGGIMWEGAVPDNPYTGFDDYQTKSIKQISDVNGDGINDVIVASGNYLVTCFNGSSSVTGDVLWVFNTGTNNNNTGSVDWEDALQIRDDVDGDGVPDVVFGCGGGNEFVYTVSGRTGQLIWAYGDSINPGRGDIMGLRVDKDYNADGIKDVLVSASGTANFGGRHAVICLNGLNGQEIFNRPTSYNFTYDVVATPWGGAIGAGNDGGPYAILGFDTLGQATWAYPLAGSLNATWSLVRLPDINSDGVPDVLGLYGFNGGLVALNGSTGASLWNISLGSSNNGKIILLDDLNTNGFADLTLSAPQVLYRLDAQSGGILWSTPLGSSYIRGIAHLSDVNGDGVRDIAAATQQPGKIVVVSGANGDTLFSYLFGTSINQRGDRVATLASIDGNLSTEFVGGNREGRVICFSGGQNTVGGLTPPPAGLPTEFSVSQNYPNPFNPTTTIEVRLPAQADMKVKIVDILGREVRTLSYEKLPAGVHRVVWDGTNSRGATVASGVYLYQVRVGDNTITRRMLLLR